MRKKLLINREFQVGFIVFMLVAAFVAIFVSFAVETAIFSKLVDRAKEYPLAPAAVRSTMNMVFIITSVVMLVILGIATLVITHRVAGPLYRVKKHLLDVAEGKTTVDIKFRDKDYFQDLVVSINLVIERIRTLEKKAGKK